MRRAAPVAESQSLTVRSTDADATSLPSGENATALHGTRVALERAARRSRRRVPEPDRPVLRCRRHQPAVRRECHGPHRTRVALERAARRSRRRVPEPDRLVPDADATSLPSGENATPYTESEWPSSVRRAAPVAESQSLTVESPDADATM